MDRGNEGRAPTCEGKWDNHLRDELERSQEGRKQQVAQAAEQQHFGARAEEQLYKVRRKLLEWEFLWALLPDKAVGIWGNQSHLQEGLIFTSY